MGKILYFSNFNHKSVTEEVLITKEVALERIEQLSWDDPEAFFTLGANCLSHQPVVMDEEVRLRLEGLNLIDDFGRSPKIIREIMQTIMEDGRTMAMTM